MTLKPTTLKTVTIKLESISLDPDHSGWRPVSEKRIDGLKAIFRAGQCITSLGTTE